MTAGGACTRPVGKADSCPYAYLNGNLYLKLSSLICVDKLRFVRLCLQPLSDKRIKHINKG